MALIHLLNLFLLLVGTCLFIATPSLRKSGSLKLEEEIAYPLLVLGSVPFAVANNYRCASGCPSPMELALFRGAANVCFVLAFTLQLRANAKKSDDGPTHPKDEPYQGGGQTYPWEDE